MMHTKIQAPPCETFSQAGTRRRPLKAGALFAGYGGLELGMSQVLDVETSWVAEVEPAPSRVLAARFPACRTSGTSPTLTGRPSSPSTSSAAGHPARISAPQESAPVCGRAPARDSGRPCATQSTSSVQSSLYGRTSVEHSTPPQLLATWNAVTSAWEKQETTLCGHSVVYSATWPSSGMTLRGQAYELPTSAPRTDDSGFSFSPGLPTPRARDWKRGGKDGVEVALLPSPRTSDMNGPGLHGTGGPDLRTVVAML